MISNISKQHLFFSQSIIYHFFFILHLNVCDKFITQCHLFICDNYINGVCLLKVIELHIYILPRDVWITKQKLAYNETIQEAISAGFIRVNQDLILGEMRSEIKKQCINEDVPPEYVFLRSVGRALTRVKPHQEFELKARYFLPPQVSYFHY